MDAGLPGYVNSVYIKGQNVLAAVLRFAKFYPRLAPSGDKNPKSIDENNPQFNVYTD
jgi:hypothetical protein